MNNEQKLIALLKKLMDTGAGLPPAAKTGLSPTQVNILDLIHNNKELTVQKLSNLLELSPPTVSVAVKKMVESGLVDKTASPGDGRVTILELTRKAAELYKEIDRYRRAKAGKLLSNLNKEEQENFLLLLGKAVRR